MGNVAVAIAMQPSGTSQLAVILPGGSTGGKGALRAEMVEILAGIARFQSTRPRGAVPAIMAASRVISAIEWELEHQDGVATLAELAGDEVRLLEWHRRIGPVLEARAAAREAKALQNGPNDAERRDGSSPGDGDAGR